MNEVSHHMNLPLKVSRNQWLPDNGLLPLFDERSVQVDFFQNIVLICTMLKIHG